MRIASLLPSATEIVYALGLGDRLVAVSHNCDYPPDVKNKIVLTSIDIDPEHATSQELHRCVSEKLRRGTSIYHIDQEALRRASPDVILTQELCQVCAPSFTEVKRAARILEGETKIVSLEPHTLEDILHNILTVGEVAGVPERAREVVSGLRQRISRIENATKNLKHRPTVFCMEWLDPIFVAGHWIPEMVWIAGGIDELGPRGKYSKRIGWRSVLDYDPEILILMPCGFHLEDVLRETRVVKAREGWDELRAVRSGRVYAVDGSSYFNRPGPRIVDGLEILAEIIHPEIFEGIAPSNSYSTVQ